MNNRAKTFTKQSFAVLVTFVLICALVLAGLPAFMNVSATSDAKGYWMPDFATIDEAHEVADELNIDLMSEGMVLMKNESGALPLEKGTGITLVGAGSYHVVSGGTGSGGGGGIRVTIPQSLRNAGFRVNGHMEYVYNNMPAAAYQAVVSGGMFGGGASTVQEDPDYIKSAEYSLAQYPTVVWTLTRVGGEGADLFRNNLPNNEDPTKHVLQLSDNEEAMLEYLKGLKEDGKIDKVIVLINTANVMEMGPLEDSDAVDGIFWLGQPGPNGLAAVGKLLSGDRNPSGKTVDIWNANHKADPTWQNFGDNSQNNTWEYNATTKTWALKEGAEVYNNNAYAMVGEGANATLTRDTKTHTVEYEEGIYLGYKYYETAWADKVLKNLPLYDTTYDESTDEDGYYNRGNGVVYPFGYGLSYTTFEQEFVTDATGLTNAIKAYVNEGKAGVDDLVFVQVKVKNTGTKAGKEVVQLYVNAPYTKPTGENKAIEKPYVQLVSFAKTGLIQPQKEETVELQVRLADIAAFDYDDANKNTYKGYEIEAGTYNFRIQANSHEMLDELACTLEAIKLDNDDDATNNTPFSNGDDYDTLLITKDSTSSATMKLMSRKDFVATFPTAPAAADKNYGTKINNLLYNGGNSATGGLNYAGKDKDNKDYDYSYRRYVENMNSSDDLESDPWYKTKEDIPADWTQAETRAAGGKTAVQLREMAGLEVNGTRVLEEGDPFYSATTPRTEADAWTLFMNQLTYAEMQTLLSQGGYKTLGLASVGKDQAQDADGPSQLGSGYTYCCEVNIASTWNIELAWMRGYMTGNDSLFLNIPGWYGPAMNIHRSAFTGRNFEYYSQDALQGGFMAAADVMGFQEKGGYAYIKHYALNDCETDRSGLATWVTEQAARENYFKNFEAAIKFGGALGIMSSFNRIGAINGFVNYHSQQTLARDEWGFKGQVVTDYYSAGLGKGNMLIRGGGNIPLGNLSGNNVITGTWDKTLREGKGGVRDGLPVYTAATAETEKAVKVTEANLAAVRKSLPTANVDDYVLAGAAPESATQYYVVRTAATQIMYVGANTNVNENGVDKSLFAGKTINATQNAALSADISVPFEELGSVASYTATNLPAGITLSSAGVFGGTPTTAGTFKVTVTMRTQIWVTATATFEIKVAPLLSCTGELKGEVGKALSIKFSQDKYAVGGDYNGNKINGVSYSLRTEVPGLTLANDGTLSGTPTKGGNYTLTVRTAITYPGSSGNSTANIDSTFTLVITDPNPAAETQFRVQNGMIQMSTDYGQTWTNVIAKDELKGDKGTDGKNGENGKDGKDAEGGCGSSVATDGIIATIVALLIAGAVVFTVNAAKKRKTNN